MKNQDHLNLQGYSGLQCGNLDFVEVQPHAETTIPNCSIPHRLSPEATRHLLHVSVPLGSDLLFSRGYHSVTRERNVPYTTHLTKNLTINMVILRELQASSAPPFSLSLPAHLPLPDQWPHLYVLSKWWCWRSRHSPRSSCATRQPFKALSPAEDSGVYRLPDPSRRNYSLLSSRHRLLISWPWACWNNASPSLCSH